jgi:hypothetical protein
MMRVGADINAALMRCRVGRNLSMRPLVRSVDGKPHHRAIATPTCPCKAVKAPHKSSAAS